MDAFNDELSSFRERIMSRAKARIEEAIKEYEEVTSYGQRRDGQSQCPPLDCV